jgi:serine/threonine protein kinase
VPSNPNPQPAAGFRPGETVAERYRILELLGSGPNSTVYRAEDKATKQVIALKVMRSLAARQNHLVAKYRIDLNVLRQVEHRAIVRVLDFGEYLGRLYVAMELVDGRSLRERLAAGPIPPEELPGFLGEMCDVLSAIHGHRVIHGGIHPGNIMLTRDGGWKLMDFGIERGGRPGDTQAAYAAPEQLLGQPSTFASDIYALGAVTYEIATGQPPPGRTAAGFPSDRQADGIPPGLAGLIEGCLRADPAKRFQSAPALKAAAEAWAGSPNARKNLSDWKTDPGLSAAELMPMFSAVVRALIEAHAAGVEHADLEPENIRYNGKVAEIEPRSKSAESSSGPATLLISNAKYTAPELIVAQRAPDPAAHACGDVYVLGFVFYELLAGKAEIRRQFGDIEDMRTGLPWMRWHADPDRKLRPLPEAVPSCPKGLAELVERMVEKSPAQRVGSLEEVAASLEKLGFILARTQPEAIRLAKTPRRKRRTKGPLLTVASAAGLLALIVGAGRFGPQAWESLVGKVGAWTGSQSEPARPASLPTVLATATGTMVLVSGDQPKLEQFYIDRLEVSNGEYREYCARTGSRIPEPPSWDPSYFTKPNHPVVNVSREAAAAYCEAVGKRLPTEQEWERAAGAGENSGVLWGNWTLPGLANLASDHPAAVGSFAADVSPFGMLDGAGNVQEWVSGANNGQSAVKGGSFATPAQDLSPTWRRVVTVNAGTPDLSSVGFRCAIEAPAGLQLSSLTVGN